MVVVFTDSHGMKSDPKPIYSVDDIRDNDIFEVRLVQPTAEDLQLAASLQSKYLNELDNRHDKREE